MQRLRYLQNNMMKMETLDTIRLNTVGKLYEKNNDIYVVYKEEEEGKKTTTR